MTEQFPPSQGRPDPMQTPDHAAVPPQFQPVGDPMVPSNAGHQPWNSAAHTLPAQGDVYRAEAAGQAPVADLGEFWAVAATETAPAPRKGRRRATILISTSVAVLLVGGVGAFAAVRMWTGSGHTQPESAMPASIGAFARVDLNPGVRDKLKFDNLIKKFPTNGTSTTGLITSIEHHASTSLGLDYDTDVKSWFDGRIGFAEWTDKAGQPTLLIALASKNDNAARTALHKVQIKQGADEFGFVVSNGYALISGGSETAQADAVAASAEAKKSPLADVKAYRSATSHLGDSNLVVAYADLRRIGSLLQSRLGAGGLGALPGIGGPDGSATDGIGGGLLPGGTRAMGGALGGMLSGGGAGLAKLTGTIAVGGSVTDDGVEIHAHSEGIPGQVSGTNVRPALDALPGGTIVGLATDGLDPNGTAVKSITGLLSGLLTTRTNSDGSSSGPPAVLLSAVTDVATKLLTAKVISVGLTGMVDGKPALQASLQARSAADATAIMSTINQFTGGALPGLTVNQAGDTIHAAYGTAGGGKLGDSALYKKTMADMSKANVVLFINVRGALGLARSEAGSVPPAVASVKAVGFGITTSGATIDELIRVVISK